MLSVEAERIRFSSVWDETSICWNKKTINKMIIILSKTGTFSYWTRTCHVSENLKNTLTMLSSEVDRICSSSVWEETSFCWNKKTVNEMIIILLNTSTFFYCSRTCHVSQNLKNTLTMCSSEFDRICSSSVWEETSFCWNKKTVNEMIIILLNTSTFFYCSRTCHVSQNLKNTLTMCSSEFDRISSSSVWEETSFCWKKKTVNKMIIILLKRSIFSYRRRTCHVSQNLKKTLTMLSSEDDRVCSSSVWQETSFFWNRKTVNELIIILLKTSTFSYWTRTCHVTRNLKIP